MVSYMIFNNWILKIKNNIYIINKNGKNLINNYIIGELDIIEENKDIRIINSYEEYNREKKFIKNKNEDEPQMNLKNELEIKNSCEILINYELIPFSY